MVELARDASTAGVIGSRLMRLHPTDRIVTHRQGISVNLIEIMTVTSPEIVSRTFEERDSTMIMIIDRMDLDEDRGEYTEAISDPVGAGVTREARATAREQRRGMEMMERPTKTRICKGRNQWQVMRLLCGMHLGSIRSQSVRGIHTVSSLVQCIKIK